MNTQPNIYNLLNDNSSKVYLEYEKEADILNSQIIKEHVNNVAVVAKYGAGKSSVINTYLKKYRSDDLSKKDNLNKLGDPRINHYVRISLSTFNNIEYDEQAIERSILQQLLYSRKKNELPNSKIERTNKSSIWKTILLVIIFTIFVTFSFFTGLGFAMQEGKTPLEILSFDWLKYLYLVIAMISFGVLFSYLLHNRYLKKFQYKDLEADFVSDKDKNVQYTNLINKFIDEVLYFFECIDVDLVIFEDLDRLPTTEIFSKLRELNLIINNSGKKTTKVTFLYAVKDDLFKTEEERAKFFDFILPIIPVINPISSKVKIEEKSKIIYEYDKKMGLSGKLIRGVSVFVPDMRILNNTFNDYILMYEKILNNEKSVYLSNDKMFALCLYKNLFPNDYALLEKNDGLIPLIINMSRLQRQCLEKINVEIQQLRSKINELDNIRIQSFEALHGLFLSKIIKLGYRGNNGTIDPWTLTTFKGIDQRNLRHPRYSNYRIELPGGVEVMGPNGERFEDIEQKIIDKNNGELEKIREKLNDLEKEKQSILHWNFEKMVKENGVDFCFINNWKDEYKQKFKLLEENESSIETQVRYLRFLISQGFIDEHYIEYTSNYKSKILSPTDTVLIQKINAGESTFNDIVDNLKQVLKLLEDEEFSKEHIIIRAILDNLSIVKNFSFSEQDRKYENLIQLLKNLDKERVKKYLINYINISEEEQCNFLLTELLRENSNLGVRLINEKDIVLERKNIILINMIKNNENFNYLKNNTIISTFFSSNEDYLNLLEKVNNDTKVYAFLSMVNVKISKLTTAMPNNKIQNYIIEHNMFEINLNNLKVILLKDNNQKEFYFSNYSYILTTSIKDYIQLNIEKYIKMILLNDEISCSDEEQLNIEELLKNENIDIEARQTLLTKVNIKIENISDYPQELQDKLLINDLIIPSWFNLEYIYEKKGFGVVKEFLEKEETIEGEFDGLEGISCDTPWKLINDILIEMNPSGVEKILRHFTKTATLKSLSLAKINDINLSIFIRHGHIEFTVSDLNLVLSLPKTLNEYLTFFKENILKDFNQFFDLALPLVQRNLSHINGRPIYKTSYIAKANSQVIIKNVLSCKDIDVVIKTTLIEKCQAIINISGYENIMARYIIENNSPIPLNILWQFSNCEQVSADDRKSILNICLNKVDFNKQKEKIELYLQNLGEDYNEFIVNDTPLNIESGSIDEILFESFKEKKIYSKTKRKNKNVYVIRKL